MHLGVHLGGVGPKSGFFIISAGDLPTPESAHGSARVPSSSDCHTGRKAHLAGDRAPFGVGRNPSGVAKNRVREYNIYMQRGVPR